jgi:y4mF family transcriptional regulator
MDDIGGFVRKKRQQAKLTQPDLAERAGVGLRFVRELENNKTTLRIDKINLVLALFGQTLGPVPIKREL